MIECSPEQVRKLVLDIQGLRTSNPCKSVLEVAERIHNIQIDTISVVSRSHNLITFNRYPEYEEGQVWQLEKEGKLFEYWSHAMCLMPIDAFPYYSWLQEQMRNRTSGWYVAWGRKNPDIVEGVYNHVKKNGVVSSAQLGERKGSSEGWWDWKKEKYALEYLMTIGRLMVSYRQGFQKYYDLTERVLPAGIDSEPMPDDMVAEYVIDTTLKCLGVADYRDFKTYLGNMTYRNIWKSKRSLLNDALDELNETVCVPVSVMGVKGDFYVHKDYTSSLDNKTQSQENAPINLLTPFDNILRERHYPKWLWDFDYSIECYTPEADRKYGYFVLPILDQYHLAGRLDAKVHRDKNLLEIKSLYIEADSMRSDEGLARFKDGIDAFATFHRCDRVSIGKVTPRTLKKKYSSLIKNR